ncbi:hypothetical protein GNF10_25440 [Nostoc sp. UCD121]|uniref:hypothetical protein n=1 Tax=unclassified Nostoc TaxID=2593658 RepID=UPI001626C1ED|nr:MULTISPECIES: hypothetical protein [unclassified Nostoc]MBC1220852.1 hypothetical protein [Nostoc sp. UCD120]MBC1279213.1 hypothetical protein [Nostoc sp. UCD121]MBC1298875.1 hypothetical protein [Nostoc sp. UCD122]
MQSDRTDSLSGYAIKSGQAWEWQPWGHLLESIKTGKPVFKNIFGMERFDYLATDPDSSKYTLKLQVVFLVNKMRRSQLVTTSHPSTT